MQLAISRAEKMTTEELQQAIAQAEKDDSEITARRMLEEATGIELQFRSFKQTFGRGQLHSRTSECSYVEMDWSLVGLWMIQLFAVKEQIKVDRPPDSSSVSVSLTIIQDAMDMCHDEVLNGRVLSRQLSEATKDEYVRTGSKSARYKPNKKDKPSATQPVLVKATDKQKQAVRELKKIPSLFP